MAYASLRLNCNRLLFHLDFTINAFLLLRNEVFFYVVNFRLKIELFQYVIDIIELFRYPYLKTLLGLSHFLDGGLIIDWQVNRTLVILKFRCEDAVDSKVFNSELIARFIDYA